MKFIFYLFFIPLITLFSCKNATENKPVALVEVISTNVNNIDTTKSNSKNIIHIGYAYDSVPELSFEKISETQFLSYKKWKKKTLVTSKPVQKDSFFYFNTQSKLWFFKNQIKDWQNRNEESWYEYVGYDSALKMYIITDNSVSENLGFGTLMLIDSLTDTHYEVLSIGDDKVTIPIPSSHNRFLVYHYNAMYEYKNCSIRILKVNSRQNPRTFLVEHASYESEDWAIEDLIWIDDNSFAVKGYEEVYENEKWVKHFSYYKSVRFE